MTGGRVRRVRELPAADEPFLLTYGDGVADVDVARADRLHRAHGALATMTAVRPSARFGARRARRRAGDRVLGEAPAGDGRRSTAASSSSSRRVIDRIDGDATSGRATCCRRWPRDGRARRLPARRLLAAHGHAAGARAAGGPVAAGRGAVEGVVSAGVWRGRAGAGHRPHRLQGRVAGASGSRRVGARSPASRSTRRPTPSLFALAGGWTPAARASRRRARRRGRRGARARRASPEVVFHLAAQALVRAAFADPAATFATNVMGTAQLLEAVRTLPGRARGRRRRPATRSTSRRRRPAAHRGRRRSAATIRTARPRRRPRS